MRNLRQTTTHQIIAELQAGVRPWVRPWSKSPGLNLAANAVTGRPYSGINMLLLWTTRNKGWLIALFGSRTSYTVTVAAPAPFEEVQR
jgi:antirestriction protein ArdC